MTELDFFGHWGYAYIGLGLLFLSWGDKWGWAFRFFGELIWIILGFMMGMSSIWLWGFIFLGVDAYGFYKWKKQEDKEIEAGVDWVMNGPDELNVLPTWVNPNVEQPTEFKYEYFKSLDEVIDRIGDPNFNGKEETNKTSKRKGQGKKVAASRSRKGKGKISARGRRHSKPANGKRRSRSNDEPNRTKGRRRKL